MKSKKILILSYAFPPLKVQMTPIVTKHLEVFNKLGYEIDVVSCDASAFWFGIDNSLSSFASKKITNLYLVDSKFNFTNLLLNKLSFSNTFTLLMRQLHSDSLKHLKIMDLSKYKAIITFSPFNTVNRVMIDLKKDHPNIPWVAQFSDPWARNPLENNKIVNLWNAYFEPKAVKAADAIVHCTRYSLDLMLQGNLKKHKNKAYVIPHFFVDELYPKRPKKKNDLITLRFLGTLFENRNPQSFFKALDLLLNRRQDLRTQISIELIGNIPEDMLNINGLTSIPPELIKRKNGVSYIESLELMYDADILLLIEAEVHQNVFFPSKLIDYLGANTRILGLISSGVSKDICEMLNTWHASPSDIIAISHSLESAIDDVRVNPSFSGYDETVRNQFSLSAAVDSYNEILKSVN